MLPLEEKVGTLRKLFSLVLVLGGLLTTAGCGGDEDKIVIPDNPLPLPGPGARFGAEEDTTPPTSQQKPQ